MARLTHWNGTKYVLPQGAWREIAERLAAYENTGWEPDEIAPKPRTTVRDLLAMDIDIDVCDDVCESLYIAFCGPMKLTAQGEEEFAYALDLEVKIGSDCAVVCVDHPEEREWRRNLREAKHLFESAAGLCSADDWDEWFVKED